MEKEGNVGVLSPKKGIKSCGGILWVIIIMIGFITLILGSIGSPHSLESKNDYGSVKESDYYGNGFGYIKEPLNAVFIAGVIISWLFSVIFGIALVAKGTQRIARLLSPIFCGIFGLVLIVCVICGAVGTFKFWQGCCNVGLPDSGDTSSNQFIHYRRSSYFPSGHPGVNWCRCTYVFKADDTGTVQELHFFYNEIYKNKQILSAWPHDFLPHVLSLAFGFLDAILHFVAICVFVFT